MPREAAKVVSRFIVLMEGGLTLVQNRTHLPCLVLGPLACLEILQFGTSSEFYAPVLHVPIFLLLIRFLEFMF